MDKNIFDIKTKINKQENKVQEKKTINQENIKELLIGYSELPISSWRDIPNGSHVRYIKKDGTFVRGGFVINNIDGLIQLANNLNKQASNYITWYASHKSISKLYKKGITDRNNVKENNMEKDMQSDIIRQMNKLTDAVKLQKTRLDNQEVEIKRLQQIMKKYLTN